MQPSIPLNHWPKGCLRSACGYTPKWTRREANGSNQRSRSKYPLGYQRSHHPQHGGASLGSRFASTSIERTLNGHQDQDKGTHKTHPRHHGQLGDAVDNARYETAKIVKDRRYSAAVKTERVEEIREDLAAKVAEIEARGDRALQRAKDEIAPPELPTSSGKALLVESQKARAWNEVVKPALDSGKYPEQVAQSLAKQGDRLAVEALSERLAPYQELARAGDINDIEFAKSTEAVRVGVDQAMSTLWTDDERAAHDGLAEVTAAHKMLQTNASIIRRDQEGAEPAIELWYDDRAEPLTLENY